VTVSGAVLTASPAGATSAASAGPLGSTVRIVNLASARTVASPAAASSNLPNCPTVVVASVWPDPAESLPPPQDNRLAQPYGGYISPGSTLDELRVFISQWNTGPGDNSPYRVIQFAVNPLKPWS